MRDRRARFGLLMGALVALALLLGCGGAGLVVRAGLAPPLDLRIPTGSYQALLIHNGPTFVCSPLSLRDGCTHRSVQYEFSVHYVSPTGDRTLVWLPTPAP